MKKRIGVMILFAILTILMTNPLFFKINTHMPGFFSSDESFAPIWDSWRIKYSLAHKFTLGHTFLIAYPFGLDMHTSGFDAYLWMGVQYFLSIFSTPTFGYNLQVLMNLFLSGLFTYLLVFYLTKDKFSAILSGIIFAFCPYQFSRVWQHLSLTYNERLPILFLTAILLKDNKNRGLLFFLALVFLYTFDHVIMYIGTVSLALFLVYILIYNWRIKFFKNKSILQDNIKYFKRVTFVWFVVFLILLPQFFPFIKNKLIPSSVTTAKASAFNPYKRSFEDLFSQSAKPLSYFLSAIVHPVFGKFTENFIGTQIYGDSLTEHTLYLGWMPIILAFVAFRRWKKNRKIRVTSCELRVTDKENFYIGFFVFLAIAAWFFSQPPWWNIFGFKLYMPSFFMYKILPMFRAYCRFGIVVMLAVAVLAGFGLKFILERFKSRKTKIAVTALFCALVLFEFWNYPPFKVIDLSKVPQVYYWLKKQSKDIVIAEYPLDADSPNELYKFFQTVHEKKIINGTIPGTYANKVAQEVRRLSEPKTISILKWMGVKYVLVHKDDYLKTDLVEDKEDMEKIPQNPGLKFVKSFSPQECPQKDIMCVQKTGSIDVYEIMAEPIEPQVR